MLNQLPRVVVLPLGVGDFMFSFSLFSVLGYFCYIYLSIGIKKIFGDLFNCSTVLLTFVYKLQIWPLFKETAKFCFLVSF